MGPILRGERVLLEPGDPSYADDLWAAIEASLPELIPFMVWASGAAPAHTRAFMEMAAKNWTDGVTNWIFVITIDGVVSGTISLLSAKPMMKTAEVGYWICSDRAGKGHMTDAVKTIARWGFDEAGMERIELRAALDNAASIRVAEKVGFVREGVLRSDSPAPNGGRYDHYMYGLVKEEFVR